MARSMATQQLLVRPLDTTHEPAKISKEEISMLPGLGSRVTVLLQSVETMARCSQQSKALLATLRDQLNSTLRQEVTSDVSTLSSMDTFDCPHCEGFMAQPVCLPCGHSMCKFCVSRLLKACSIVCPKCKEPLSMNRLHLAENHNGTTNRKPTLILQNLFQKWYPKWVESCKYREEGNMFANEGDFPLAIHWYNKAASTGVRDHRVLGNRSRSYLAMNSLDEALMDAEEACKIRPFWKKGHLRRASVLEEFGRWRDAVAAYLLCLHLAGNDHSVTIKLCQLLDQHMSEFSDFERSASVYVYCNPGRSLDEICSSSDSSQISTIDAIVKLCVGVICEAGEGVKSEEEMGHLDSQDFECSLCTGLIFEPVTTTCGHSFCRSCLCRSFDHSPACPVCRTVLHECFQSYCKKSGVMIIDESLDQVVQRYCSESYQQKKSQIEADSLHSYRVGTSESEPLPIFVCTLALPGMPCPLHVFEPRYRLMIRRGLESGSRRFGICQPAASEGNEHSFSDYGTVLYVNSVEYTPDGRSLVKTVGERRFKVMGRDMVDGYHRARVAFLFDERVTVQSEIDYLRALQQQVYFHAKRWLDALPQPAKVLMMHAACSPLPPIEKIPECCPNGPMWVWWYIHSVPITPLRKLEMYTCNSLKERLLKLKEALPVVS